MTLHGKEIYIGDRVYSIKHGWGTVTDISNSYITYSITADFESGYVGIEFTPNGKLYLEDASPTLFWKEQTFDLSKPLPKLGRDTLLKVWNENSDRSNLRYFSRFSGEDGGVFVYAYGATSKTTDGNLELYYHYEVVE